MFAGTKRPRQERIIETESDSDESAFPSYSSISTENSATDLGTAESTMPSPRPRKNRSWIFINGWIESETVISMRKLRCLICKQLFSCPNNSTSPALRHLKTHNITKSTAPRGIAGMIQSPLIASFSSSQCITPPISAQTFKTLIVDMLIECRLPFLLTEKPSFQRLLNYAQSASNMEQIQAPNADTIRTWMQEIYEKQFKKLLGHLQLQPSISYTTDLWTSPWLEPYMCITAHWIDSRWCKREALIAFEHVTGAQTGENLALIFVEVLEQMGLLESLFTITCDDASNMTVMAETIERIGADRSMIEFVAKEHKIPCIGHILNLAVQTLLKVGFNSEPPEDLDQAVFAENDQEEPLHKLRRGIVYIRSSPQRREKFKRHCQDLILPTLEPILDVKTRWNSTLDMLERALLLRGAYDEMINEDKMKLTPVDWEMIQALIHLLEPFRKCTLVLSKSKYPTVNKVIPTYFELMTQLGKVAMMQDISPLAISLKAGAQCALRKLNKYYFPPGYTSVYAIATAMDPRAKLSWWNSVGWEPEAAKQAKDHVSEAWRYFRPESQPRDQFTNPGFHPIYQTVNDNEYDELESYAEERPSPDRPDFDELTYWRGAEELYPALAKMAKKYLSVCATSTPSERCFSHAKLFVPHLRNRLSPQAVKESMLLASWKKFFEDEKRI